MTYFKGNPLTVSSIKKMGMKDLGAAIQSLQVKGIQKQKEELQNLLIKHLSLDVKD